VLPAYLVGMALAPAFLTDHELPHRLRVIAFGILTPFYFLKAGSLIDSEAVIASAGLITVFLVIKMVTKFAGILPLTTAFRFDRREGMYTTLLMSTGLTFGSISALFGLTNHIIDQTQYTILVTAVIGSAVVPTLIAQQWFVPAFKPIEHARLLRLRRSRMYRKLLIASDGSEGARKALAAAIQLAKRFRAQLHMLSVEEVPRFPTTLDEIVEEQEEAGRLFDKLIAQSVAQAKKGGVRIEAHVAAGHAVPTIVDFIERGGFDLLVIGYMGHSALYNRLIGSTTDRLVELAPCNVLVVK
jgi:nucleotide-binding universal stress UspA family protein